jgi:hypothetical protein
VGIGVVAGEVAVFEPEDAFGTEPAAERRFDAFPVKVRIAVGTEQAFGGGEKGAGAVALDAAALEDQPRHAPLPGAEGACRLQAGGGLVVLVGGELEAPAVEAEIEQDRHAVFQDGERPEVAAPGVVCGDGVDGDPLQHNSRRCQFAPGRFHFGSDDQHPLAAADLLDDFNEDRLHQVQDGVPVACFMGPGEQDAVLRRPFRR